MQTRSKSRPASEYRRLVAASRLFVLLFLALCLIQQPAYSQAPGSPAEDDPNKACDNKQTEENYPPPGKTAKVIGDDEIFLVYRNDATTPYLQQQVINFDTKTGKLTTLKTEAWNTDAKLASGTWWQEAAAGDLNGIADGKRVDRLVAGLRNANNQINAIADAPVNSSADKNWYCNTTTASGSRCVNTEAGNVSQMDIAVGNLDASGDESDEIAITWRDAARDYALMTVDGGDDGTISTAPTNWWNYYWDDGSRYHPERGEINHLAIATGDLNGDGYDNEIVTAFKDSKADLQVQVHRGDTLLELFWWDGNSGNPKLGDVGSTSSGYNNWRPIDVATGDVDGDLKDEAIVAVRNGGGTASKIRLLVFDFKDEDPSTHALTIDTSVPVVSVEWPSYDGTTHSSYYGLPAVSIAAADLDDDGADEIAVGYTRHIDRSSDYGTQYFAVEQALVAYQFFPINTSMWEAHCPQPTATDTTRKACLWRYTNIWYGAPYRLGDDVDIYSRVSVAAGDIDGDGTAEIALAHPEDNTNPNTQAKVRVFRADTNTLKLLDTLTFSGPAGDTRPPHDFSIAMGDYDGDSKWGTFANTCSDKKQAIVQAVIQAPPVWTWGIEALKGCANDWEAYANFGYHLGKIDEQEKTVSTTIGGSVKTAAEHKRIGGSFTRKWERTAETVEKQSTSQTLAWGVETASRESVFGSRPPEESYLTGALTIENTQYCYDYDVPGLDATNPSAVATIPVCAYQPNLEDFRSWSSVGWYSDEEGEGARSLYGDSWIPLGANLAVDTTQKLRRATQSSTLSGPPAGDAYHAVDGNTGGVYGDGSVTATNPEVQPWWQVDMGGLQWIDAIQIWNRTDGDFGGRTKDYYLLTTQEEDFARVTKSGPYKPLSDLLGDATVWKHHEVEEAGTPTTITVQQFARVVRVQLASPYTNTLNLAEVEVYGRPATPDQWPMAMTPDDGSFDLTWRANGVAGITTTLSGPVYMYWDTDAAIYTTADSLPFDFATGGGGEHSYLTGSGIARSLEVGMEVKKEGKATRGRDAGIGRETTYASGTTWGSEVEFGGHVSPVPGGHNVLNYHWAPYIWMNEVVPPEGGTVNYLVLDYTVTDDRLTFPSDIKACEATEGAAGPTPQAPRASSPTHPDPEAWSSINNLGFTWVQPPGDPATVSGYAWALDHERNTDPRNGRGMVTTATYNDVGDGVWYLHVRAANAQGQYGPTTHRQVHVDSHAPQVSLALDPAQATGNAGWYTTPVDVTVVVADADGSGVKSVELSLDGLTWQPYLFPLHLAADTAGTTIYTRATDLVGNVSQPVSTTIKIDRTPPSSHVAGGAGPGALVAEVTTDRAGNPAVVLAGAISDNLSGRGGIALREEGTYWGADPEVGSWRPLPDPAIEVNWVYTATHDLGAGYHIFTGRARDEAGNQEASYEIARLLVPPQASPDLRGSTIAASQQTARPGDEILLIVSGRNAGFQEAQVGMSAVLPIGLEPIFEALGPDVSYNAATRTVTWPPEQVWPGQWEKRFLRARVATNLGAATLETAATFHAFWPNTDLLTEAERQPFLDREQTVVAANRIVVSPKLAASADLVAPWVIVLPSPRDQVTGSEVTLSITAAPDSQRMYLREWAPDPLTGAWKVVQNSGWVDYQDTYTWELSAGQGVRFVGVWVADAAGNVSTLEDAALPFVNRVDTHQALAGGQRIQYRVILDANSVAWASLKTVSGDPDLYTWGPRNGFWPDRSANATLQPGDSEELATDEAGGGGRYILEVQAVGASEYDLSLPGRALAAANAAGAAVTKPRPAHPLTVSDPLSAGQVGPAVTPLSYLPLIFYGK